MDAGATTRNGGVTQATRRQAAGRPANAATPLPVRDAARAAPAALSAPIHRPALVIQPHSLFCILLVGGTADRVSRPPGRRKASVTDAFCARQPGKPERPAYGGCTARRPIGEKEKRGDGRGRATMRAHETIHGANAHRADRCMHVQRKSGAQMKKRCWIPSNSALGSGHFVPRLSPRSPPAKFVSRCIRTETNIKDADRARQLSIYPYGASPHEIGAPACRAAPARACRRGRADDAGWCFASTPATALPRRYDARSGLTRAIISPTIPRRNASTHAMKISPVTIVADSPSE
ncbi:hypothetical protein BPS26883_04428 [Burkholderia pseudomultivorans]|uniref:Uncharacterized protein n=1 Tax=Burkholderia pseudomultivorans TaxID=1207504 RepID=A0A6P2NF71_9BURK|nr:hypothetical protein BPS26883_04428 [Burkholderia pseudomultivorans]